jgi:hypothetical protein
MSLLIRDARADDAPEVARLYEGIGYTNIKTQYSLAKLLDAASPEALRAFVPNVD